MDWAEETTEAGAVLPSLEMVGTGMEEGYGPYSSRQVGSLESVETEARLGMDVEGLMRVVRSTDELVDLEMLGAMVESSLGWMKVVTVAIWNAIGWNSKRDIL